MWPVIGLYFIINATTCRFPSWHVSSVRDPRTSKQRKTTTTNKRWLIIFVLFGTFLICKTVQKEMKLAKCYILERCWSRQSEGGRLLQTHTLVGQEAQLSISCPIRVLYPNNNNTLTVWYYTMLTNHPPLRSIVKLYVALWQV